MSYQRSHPLERQRTLTAGIDRFVGGWERWVFPEHVLCETVLLDGIIVLADNSGNSWRRFAVLFGIAPAGRVAHSVAFTTLGQQCGVATGRTAVVCRQYRAPYRRRRRHLSHAPTDTDSINAIG